MFQACAIKSLLQVWQSGRIKMIQAPMIERNLRRGNADSDLVL